MTQIERINADNCLDPTLKIVECASVLIRVDLFNPCHPRTDLSTPSLLDTTPASSAKNRRHTLRYRLRRACH